MKENIKTLAGVLLFSSLFFTGCDTASSSDSTSSIIGSSSSGTSLPVTITDPITEGEVVESVGGVVSGSNIVTSARGDAPPAPPVIVSE